MKKPLKHRIASLRHVAVMVLLAGLVSPTGLLAFAAPPGPVSLPATGPTLSNPILFVTQVPTKADFQTVTTTFANQEGGVQSAARGGDLWIRYPDGSLKNLTAAAGYGVSTGFQGANAIAVRDPAVYWDVSKAIFSMVIGAPVSAGQPTPGAAGAAAILAVAATAAAECLAFHAASDPIKLDAFGLFGRKGEARCAKHRTA